MATYPIKMLKDESNMPFVPLVSTEGITNPQGQTLEDLLKNKLEANNLKGGDHVVISTQDNDCYISVDLPDGLTVINNLTTTSAGQGTLDAYQGKVLKDSIPQVINNLTTVDTTNALSAYQGYLLDHKFNDYVLNTTLNNYYNKEEIDIALDGVSGTHIGPDEPESTGANLWVDTDEGLISVGTEVINSLDGSETNMAPSVAITKASFMPIDAVPDLSIKAAQDESGNNIILSYAHAGAINMGTFDDIGVGDNLYRTFIGTLDTGSGWYNLINLRHRNGHGDGTSYGLQIRTVLTGRSPLEYRQQMGNSAGWSDWTVIDNWYSNSEIRIGRWTNGKSIYRKVIHFDGEQNGDIAVPHGISNLDQVLDVRYRCDDAGTSNGTQYANVRISADDNHVGITGVTNTSIVFNVPAAFNTRITDVDFIIEYTKTTN